MSYPTINEGECVGCGSCVEECPFCVLAVTGGIAKVEEPDDCAECGCCVDACLPGCIAL